VPDGLWRIMDSALLDMGDAAARAVGRDHDMLAELDIPGR
jgi:hypothetical protein